MNHIKSIISNAFQLLQLLWNEDKWHLLGYFTATMLAAGFSIASYFAYKAMIDAVFANLTLTTTTSAFFVVLTYLFTQQISNFLYSFLSQFYFDYVVRSKFQNIIMRTFMFTLAHLDFAHLEDGEIRNLIVRVQDTSSWRLPEIIQHINYILFNIVSLILTLIIALQFHIIYFLIIAFIVLPFYVLRAKYGNVGYSIYSLNGPKTNMLWYFRWMFTSFPIISEIKMYGLQNYFINQTKVIQDELLTEYRRPILQYSLIASIEYILTPLAGVFIINHFLSQLISHHQSIGSFTLFVSILFGFAGNLTSILSNLSSIYENNLYANDYFKLLGTKNTIVSPTNAFVFPDVQPREIIFDQVSFTYPDNPYKSLDTISFTIHQGEDLAIVGHNGAGKTTLIKLLLRFYDPTEGRILVDGKDLRTINIASWYQQLGTLFQDFARYDLSLQENITIGNLTKQNKELLQTALKEANGEDILKELKKGWDQRLGKWMEDGQELSVGQWQKVAIARALFRNAPILIMDEPTANIDAQAEAEIFENLKKVYKNKSLIFISHRFSTVRMADRIVVIDKGQLVEQGSHQELLKKKGLYAKYFNLQKKGYE